MSQGQVIEIAAFRLVSGADEEDFLKISDNIHENFLKKQNGFVSRELLKSESGDWADIVRWKSMEEAQKATQEMLNQANTIDSVRQFIEKIDPRSVSMKHFHISKEY